MTASNEAARRRRPAHDLAGQSAPREQVIARTRASRHRRLRRAFAAGWIQVAAATAVLVLAAVAFSARPQVTTHPGAKDPGPSPTLGAKPPAPSTHRAVLFDGRAFTGWHQRDGKTSQWEVQRDGSVQVNGGDAITDLEWSDFHLHLEFMCPKMPEKAGQARANSGVYLHGRYEVQVLDSFGLAPAKGSCGALYSIATPRVNASRPPGTWQTYDIVFRGPRLHDDGAASAAEDEPARVTVLHNGIVIHNNLVLPHTTPGGIDGEVVTAGPLLLQDHGDAVRYRNIWIASHD